MLKIKNENHAIWKKIKILRKLYHGCFNNIECTVPPTVVSVFVKMLNISFNDSTMYLRFCATEKIKEWQFESTRCWRPRTFNRHNIIIEFYTTNPKLCEKNDWNERHIYITNFDEWYIRNSIPNNIQVESEQKRVCK